MKPVYSCRIFDLYEDEVALPNGQKTTQTRLDHKPSVAIVALNAEQEVLLISQYRGAIQADLLEIPAGSIDRDGESPEAAARRELSEETGFGAEKLTLLFAGYSLPGYCNEYMYYYLAENLFPQKLPGDEDECITVKPIALTEALRLLPDGKLTDAKTALGLLLTAQHLKI
ncbi:ADP-ribose pyrophosphatase [Candidatus Termititenax persephonae]|uniref:ADP-ribose pyrophosphatase n=1 Tax=Candidatus Termititenax persephonae TaxID=2218525 RepID=A0A388TJJ0_9BACT|nr:ADP-ribose pyrophosphatase [Candidatus Termititenax persephonae]